MGALNKNQNKKVSKSPSLSNKCIGALFKRGGISILRKTSLKLISVLMALALFFIHHPETEAIDASPATGEKKVETVKETAEKVARSLVNP